MDSETVNNLVHAGVLFLVYLFIMICLYFFLSSPVDAMLNGISDVPLGEASDEMARFSPDIKWAVKAAFALGIATPLTWFVFWVFSKEPFIGYRRRY